MNGAESAGPDAVDPAAGNRLLDERGNPCPGPVLALGRWAKLAEPGDTAIVLTDDPASESDIPAWCRMRGAEHVGAADVSGNPGVRQHVVRLGG